MAEPEDRNVTAAAAPLPLPASPADMAAWFRASGVLDDGVQSGEMVPDFELRAASGAFVSLQDLLDRGPAVITFTLGAASPRCRRALLALQAALPDIARHGAALIAITPDPPDVSRDLTAGGGLTFDLLSDEGGHLAALFGIAYRPPVEMAAWLARLELAPAAGWRSAELPLTAAYVVTGDGIAAWTFVDADPLARAEPRHIIEALDRLPAQGSPANA